ncbi:MAG: flavodoxin-dependent (E)-4-hydroxy-3-methylbut-2-enyl-diphosphate synthase [candidate division FCPU426 bacterium]
MNRAPRLVTRLVKVGNQVLGHGSPVLVQSMTNTPTEDAGRTLAQIRRLAAAGCELVRVAVPTKAAAAALSRIVTRSPLPVIADIHFDHELALAAIAASAAKVRINPGNLGLERSLLVARAAAKAKVAVRIGVNAGSLPERWRQGAATPAALGRLMAKTAVRYALALEKAGLRQIVLSVKASDILASLAAYRQLAATTRWPLHLGITEAGGELAGSIKTAAGLAPLLVEGIGDTLRVSLTADPVREIRAANLILAATGVRQRGPDIIACPTCGRTAGDLFGILKKVEQALLDEPRPLTVAVMGCVVNGPGEARHADAGLAGAQDGSFILFAQGKPLRRVSAAQAVPALLAELKKIRTSGPGRGTH